MKKKSRVFGTTISIAFTLIFSTSAWVKASLSQDFCNYSRRECVEQGNSIEICKRNEFVCAQMDSNCLTERTTYDIFMMDYDDCLNGSEMSCLRLKDTEFQFDMMRINGDKWPNWYACYKLRDGSPSECAKKYLCD